MKIAVGADHAGFELKEALVAHLAEQGHDVEDVGTHSTASTDYPDYAHAVAEEVAASRAERGLLVCGSGTGMAIAANKVSGVRAANCWDADSARLARAHNNANVLTVGARFVPRDAAAAILDTFLATDFEGGRHAQRVDKIEAPAPGRATC